MLNCEISKEEIIGAWELDSYKVKMDTGETFDLWGKNTTGILIYLPNGYMSVHVSDKDRPKFKDNDFLSGEFKEVKAAFERYTTYFGTYKYDPENGVVFHYVAESLFPNWSGVTHKRFVVLEGDECLLKTPPTLIKGEKSIMELHWKRLNTEKS